MIGFTSVSLRPYSIEEVVDAAVKAKAEIIEWGSDVHIKTSEDAEKAKKLCDENGIIINSYGTYYRIGSFGKEWRNLCENASIMGAKYIRTWLGTKGSDETSEEEYQLLLEDARRAADIAREYGITVCNECHPNTFNDTTESALSFLNDVNRDNIKTYYQSWYRTEASDKEKLFRTIRHVQDVHISFSELEKFQQGYAEDKRFIEKILGWLKELDFGNALIIEFVRNDSPEELIRDIERLKALWK